MGRPKLNKAQKIAIARYNKERGTHHQGRYSHTKVLFFNTAIFEPQGVELLPIPHPKQAAKARIDRGLVRQLRNYSRTALMGTLAATIKATVKDAVKAAIKEVLDGEAEEEVMLKLMVFVDIKGLYHLLSQSYDIYPSTGSICDKRGYDYLLQGQV
jgi:hypothetical protein